MDKHTTGPWLVAADDGEDEDGWMIVAAEAMCDTVAHPTAQPTAGEELANARLIAAAPDLLNGCRAMLGLIQLISGRDDLPAELREVFRDNHRIQEAEAALAKAECSREGDRT